jgi:hypothetical protein
LTVISQLVQPGEWPGVECAVGVVSPSVTFVAFLDGTINLHGGEGEVFVLLVARIVAAFEQRLVALAGDELCASLLHDLGEAAGVVEMGVRVENVDVGDLEAELRQVRNMSARLVLARGHCCIAVGRRLTARERAAILRPRRAGKARQQRELK